MKMLIYCTKAKPMVAPFRFEEGWKYKAYDDTTFYAHGCTANIGEDINGKVVAEFDGEVEELACEILDTGVGCEPIYYTDMIDNIYNKSCLTQCELEDYLGSKAGGEIVGYAIHIENLNAYDTPKELGDYYYFRKCNTCKVSGYESSACQYDEDCMVPVVLEKAPQNMMKIYDEEGNEYCLISIRPQWVEKILNGEKTIEVRKKILKDMATNKSR